MADPEDEPTGSRIEELEWRLPTETEIERALKAASATSAPGVDGRAMLGWEYFWGYISTTVCKSSNASIHLGHQPKRWKAASIVGLKKPGKT
jgi:formylglycine-generating enzyme required for sulfatase activity